MLIEDDFAGSVPGGSASIGGRHRELHRRLLTQHLRPVVDDLSPVRYPESAIVRRVSHVVVRRRHVRVLSRNSTHHSAGADVGIHHKRVAAVREYRIVVIYVSKPSFSSLVKYPPDSDDNRSRTALGRLPLVRRSDSHRQIVAVHGVSETGHVSPSPPFRTCPASL